MFLENVYQTCTALVGYVDCMPTPTEHTIDANFQLNKMLICLDLYTIYIYDRCSILYGIPVQISIYCNLFISSGIEKSVGLEVNMSIVS